MEYQIRPVRVEDAAGIHALRKMPGVFENIFGLPSEREKRSEDYLKGLDANTHMLVAVARVEGEEVLIGSIGLSISANPRVRHSGGIGLMVHRDYQNAGVGTALLTAILDLADNWLMLVRVELTVFSDNQRARHLYEKCGFEWEGVKRMAAVRAGVYADEIMMARIHPQFRAMAAERCQGGE